MTTPTDTPTNTQAELDRLTESIARCQFLVLQIQQLENKARTQKERQRGAASLLAAREAYVWREVRRRLTAALNGGTDAAVIDLSAFHLDVDSNELVCGACGERRPKSALGLMQLREHTHAGDQ